MLLNAKEKECSDLKLKIAEVYAVMPGTGNGSSSGLGGMGANNNVPTSAGVIGGGFAPTTLSLDLPPVSNDLSGFGSKMTSLGLADLEDKLTAAGDLYGGMTGGAHPLGAVGQNSGQNGGSGRNSYSPKTNGNSDV